MSNAAPKQSQPTRPDTFLRDAEACALMHDRGVWDEQYIAGVMKARHPWLPDLPEPARLPERFEVPQLPLSPAAGDDEDYPEEDEQ